MLGLVSSLVLRCNDCVKYHIERCFNLGVTENEFFKILAIGNVFRSTIIILHLRKDVRYWDELKKLNENI